MQALRLQDQKSPLKIETVKIPKAGPQDVIIKVGMASLTSGVDVLSRMRPFPVPKTIGHEAAGIVADLGKDVTKFKVGDRVRLEPFISCGQCRNCQTGKDNLCVHSAMIGLTKFEENSPVYDEYSDGGVAEYVRAPYCNVDPIPDNVAFEAAVKMPDLGTGLQALKSMKAPPNSTVAVIGATGTMGTAVLRIADQFPIKKIILIGRSKERLEGIRSLTKIRTEIIPVKSVKNEGANIVQQLHELAPEGISGIIDLAPFGDTFAQTLPALTPGGTAVHIGGNPTPLPIPLRVAMAKGWHLTGNRGYTREDTVQLTKWLAEGELNIDDLVTHRFSMDEFQKILDIMDNRKEFMWMNIIDINP